MAVGKNKRMEYGASSQPQASLVVEHLGNNVLEPSLTTREALDKYQVVAQKYMECEAEKKPSQLVDVLIVQKNDNVRHTLTILGMEMIKLRLLRPQEHIFFHPNGTFPSNLKESSQF